MKRTLSLAAVILSSWHFAIAQAQPILVQPEHPTQGAPLMISLPGTHSLSDIQSVRFDSLNVPIFLYKDQPTALVGVDLNATPGNHNITVSLLDGKTIKQTIIVSGREKETLPLGIPEKLGGDTAASGAKLVTSLEKENRLLNNLTTNKKKLWNESFVFPVADPMVIDSYGYTRETSGYMIAHKGTDFRAPTGTSVRAMNRGVVRLARYSPVYGNMVVVDHGMGLMTFYMHLSKTKVKTGQLVEQGQLVGLSGQTGYATGPHLHLSIRLNNTSIDPMAFMGLFK